MAQFGGQKNPPWATQFTATAVSQPAALGVQQPSLLGASPTIYTQQTALAAAGLSTQTPTNYQLSQTAALQQQAAAAAAALQQYDLHYSNMIGFGYVMMSLKVSQPSHCFYS